MDIFGSFQNNIGSRIRRLDTGLQNLADGFDSHSSLLLKEISMKLIDADELMRTIKKDCEASNNPSLWFLLGFISRYLDDAPDLGIQINKHPLESE